MVEHRPRYRYKAASPVGGRLGVLQATAAARSGHGPAYRYLPGAAVRSRVIDCREPSRFGRAGNSPPLAAANGTAQGRGPATVQGSNAQVHVPVLKRIGDWSLSCCGQ